jgi:hypothetical protein
MLRRGVWDICGMWGIRWGFVEVFEVFDIEKEECGGGC